MGVEGMERRGCIPREVGVEGRLHKVPGGRVSPLGLRHGAGHWLLVPLLHSPYLRLPGAWEECICNIDHIYYL